MVKIKLHGYLAKKFGEDFELNLVDPKLVVDAIDASNEGFKREVMKMHKQGFHYAMIIDGKDISDCTEKDLSNCKEMEIVPMIVGQILPFLIPIIASFASAAVIAAGWGLVATTLALIAISVVAAVLLAALTPDGPDPVLSSSESRSLEQSYKFSNKANITRQGNALPIGYGRMIIGSNVIGFREIDYQTNYRITDAYLSEGSFRTKIANSSTY
mgnify:CR=1 FL=1